MSTVQVDSAIDIEPIAMRSSRLRYGIALALSFLAGMELNTDVTVQNLQMRFRMKRYLSAPHVFHPNV